MTFSLSYGDRSGTYTREVNEQGVLNGKGKFTTKNAQGNPWIYEGDFKNGHFEGQGRTIWSNDNEEQSGNYSNDSLR